ncbi:MAG: ABC transporter ATP-binding protein [Chloroflexi bacterium]|nr:ABC transporter ATP-binding protein [Chloroflexota bacterium]
MSIELHNISKIYRKRGKPPVEAVKNIDLTVGTGQVIGFLGPNGAGKTTTIKMMCGLVIPSSGHILLNGINSHTQRGKAMREIGAVLEGTRNIYWRLTAWQNLMYFGRLKGMDGNELRSNAERLLTELDLWERRHDATREFSRGMQQKVAIACALVADPPIVLLDEPTLGLDVQAARTVKDWVKKLGREQGKTVILTTHHLAMAQEVCDRVVIMRKGQIIADHQIQELLNIFREDYYRIKVHGHLNGHEPPALAALKASQENGDTLFSGSIDSQQTLYRILDDIRESQLPLLGVERIEPDLEDVFVRLTQEGE